jgi:maltose O-acetyltransferase
LAEAGPDLDTGCVTTLPEFNMLGQPIAQVVRVGLHNLRETSGAVLAVLRAAASLRGCRSVGQRARLYGRCLVSGRERIEIGEHLLILATSLRCELTTHEEGQLSIGDRVFINYGTTISAHSWVRIGDDCKIGQYSIIMDCDWHDLDTPGHYHSHGVPKPVVLEQGVWLGARVIILKGVTIGRGSVIGAGSVVVKDIPEGVLAAGTPARVIRELPFKASLPGPAGVAASPKAAEVATEAAG